MSSRERERKKKQVLPLFSLTSDEIIEVEKAMAVVRDDEIRGELLRLLVRVENTEKDDHDRAERRVEKEE